METMSTEPPEYEHHTRGRYRDPSIANAYAARQQGLRSPAESGVAYLEKHLISSYLHRYVHATGRVIDVPAGSGKLMKLLNEWFGDAAYVGADMSFEMLSAGPDHRTVQADGVALPFKDLQFQVAVSLRLLHRVPLPVFRSLLAEFGRVARETIIVSYAGEPLSSPLYGLVGSVLRRPRPWVLRLSKDEFASEVGQIGWDVRDDRSISARLTSERIAVLVRA